MRCPQCGEATQVIESRATRPRSPDRTGANWLRRYARRHLEWYSDDYVVRKRLCRSCSWQAKTLEIPGDDLISMLKEAAAGNWEPECEDEGDN